MTDWDGDNDFDLLVNLKGITWLGYALSRNAASASPTPVESITMYLGCQVSIVSRICAYCMVWFVPVQM